MQGHLRLTSIVTGLCVFAVSSNAWAQAPASATPPTAQQFAALQDHITPALSPDGARIAYTERVDGKLVVTVITIATRERKTLMTAEMDGYRVRWCRFKNDTRLLCSFLGWAEPKLEASVYMIRDRFVLPVTRLVAVDADGGQVLNLVSSGSLIQDDVVDWLSADSTQILVNSDPDKNGMPEVLSLDVNTGKTTVVQANRDSIHRWITDRKSVVRFGYGCTFARCVFVTRDSATSEWRSLKWTVDPMSFVVLGFGPSNQTLLVRQYHNGRQAIFEMEIAGKAEGQLVYARPDVDVSHAFYWPTDGRIAAFVYATDKFEAHFIDDEVAAIDGAMRKALAGAVPDLAGASRDSNVLLISAKTDRKPNEYYLLDRGKRSLVKLAYLSSELARTPLAPMKAVEIPGPDGVKLPGYLTIPEGVDPKKLTAVVYPHGGPHARDHWGFDPVVQWLASRGHAVLQVNFRGSTGYGKEWFDAGFRKWGTVMIDDVIAATKWLHAQGIASAQRTCIVGWSFGGYAALMSSVREPDLYRCTASIAGISDLKTMRWDTTFWGTKTVDMALGTDSDALKAGSPARGASRIKGPVLLLHGTIDMQADYEQSRRMAAALQDAKVKYEFVTIENGDHSLDRVEWRLTLYEKLDEFLAKNLN